MPIIVVILDVITDFALLFEHLPKASLANDAQVLGGMSPNNVLSNIVRVDNAFESVADDVMIVVVEVMSSDNVSRGA